MGNAVCRNFLFPLGWPACGVNSSLPAGGGLRNFDAPSFPLTRRDVGGVLGEVRERGTFAVTTVSPRNGAYTTAALPPTVPDQMTRASAHNNGLFTLQSYPIPKPRPGIPAPLSTDLDGSALLQFENAGVQYRSSGLNAGNIEFESRECGSDLRIQKNFKTLNFVRHGSFLSTCSNWPARNKILSSLKFDTEIATKNETIF